jgi:hypothetical protein
VVAAAALPASNDTDMLAVRLDHRVWAPIRLYRPFRRERPLPPRLLRIPSPPSCLLSSCLSIPFSLRPFDDVCRCTTGFFWALDHGHAASYAPIMRKKQLWRSRQQELGAGWRMVLAAVLGRAGNRSWIGKSGAVGVVFLLSNRFSHLAVAVGCNFDQL